MGGAGTAAHVSVLGTFFLNPAGLLAYEGTRVEFSFEMFKPDRTVSSNMPGIGSGSTRSKSEFTPIPALGFAIRVNDRLSLGLGGIGIAGFGVDYPQNNANPINGPRPFGFGQIYSNYSLLKFTPAIAYAITEDFWIGGAANVSWATLSIDPAPFAPPAVTFGQEGTRARWMTRPSTPGQPPRTVRSASVSRLGFSGRPRTGSPSGLPTRARSGSTSSSGTPRGRIRTSRHRPSLAACLERTAP
jgi:long-subunit fatty acid transport protein